MARMRERIFAGMGAFLFLGSASALTIFVIMNPGADSTAKKDTAQQQTCTDTQTEAALPVPDVYKPDGAVADLQKTDLADGSGPAANSGDCLVVKYYGTLASDGTKFDENFTTSTAFAFKLGQGQVIQGWDQGVVGMKAGGMRRLVIPAALGYGDQAQGSIPANSDLVFVVKLLRIQN
jgi:FKBP-type peptidyl-prolyl cis-trans isomerase